MSEFKLSTYQQAIVDEYRNGTENLFINALAGCVDCDTEYFNGTEWKRIADYREGDKVLSYNIDTKEAVLDYPLDYIKQRCSYMWHFYKENISLDQVLCDDHSILNHKGEKIKVHNWLDNPLSIHIPSYFYYKYNNKDIFENVMIQHYIPFDCKPTIYKTKDGYKYCFTMPLGTLILRRNDKIFITGNCSKTTILIELSKYTDKYSVFLAFNKSIQEELKGRIINPKFKTYTFNGLGYMIMNHNWDKMEEERLKKNIAPSHKRNLILEQYKSRQNASQVMKLFKDKIGLDESDEDYITMMYDIATLYDLCRQRLVNLSSEEDLLDTIEFYDLFNDVWVPSNIVEIMEQMLELDKIQFFNDGIIDFTDQLYITYIMVVSQQWKMEMFHTFENIMVDEGQDLSRLQQLFIGILKRRKTTRIVIVFDKNQAIYSFNGADCHSVDTLKRLYSAKEMELPINYRCPIKHLEYVRRKFDIPIQPRPDAPEGTLKRISYESIGNYIKKGDCILARKNKDLCKVMLDLLAMGHSVYMRDETLVNSIISKITTFKKLLKEDLSKLPEVIDALFEEQEKKEQEKLDKLINEGKVDSSNDISLSNNVIDLLDCIMVIYGNYKRKYMDDNEKLNSFKDFIKFVEALLQTKDIKNSIQCTSIHQAKGKEYDRVFILNEAKVYYELGRNADQIQQEINLSYIALTRSKDTIYLVSEPIDEDDEDFDTMMFTDYDENTANEMW